MRNFIVFSMISLDGVLQAPGGPDEDTSGSFRYGGWTAAYGDELFGKIMQEELKPATYLLGRKTFDIFESYWPQHADYWPGINEGDKYVLSQSRDKSDWKNTHFLNDMDSIKKLKHTDGSDIHVWGSSELVHLLLKHDLVDELRVKIYPLILGEGKKLFDNGAMPAAFTLADGQVTSKGVIIANYKRAGAIVTGDIEV